MGKPTPVGAMYNNVTMVLSIEFEGGGLRQFKGANQDHHDRFQRCNDKAKFFANEIDGKFEEIF